MSDHGTAAIQLSARAAADALPSTWRRMLAEAETGIRRGSPSRTACRCSAAALVLMLATAALQQGRFATPGGVLLLATVLAWVPLLWRTQRPIACLAAVLIIESLHVAVLPMIVPTMDRAVQIAGYQPVPLATMVATWTVVTRTPRLLGWICSVAAALLLLAVALVFRPLSLIGTDMMMFDLVLITAGFATVVATQRDRVARLEGEKEFSVAQAVLDERLRIARELHDVLAHQLTLVNVKAGVAMHLLETDRSGAVAALDGITDHTSRAIDELQVTIGLLRRDEPDMVAGDPAIGADVVRRLDRDELRPVPGLARLDELVTEVRAHGCDVSARRVGGEPALGDHVDLAAFRIVQEALTNAVKHAAGAPVDVLLKCEREFLRIRVSNQVPAHVGGSRPPRPRASGTGHGLIGMRERAAAAGGTFFAGLDEDGHFVVEAILPLLLSELA